MVSVYPIPPPGQDFTHFHSNIFMNGSGGGDGGSDVMDMGLVGFAKRRDDDMSFIQAAQFVNPVVEDPNKKIRKPYTITKSRESWTDEEHDRFLEALHLFDRDWKKIEAFVGSKTVIQIRSHAQKYFMKVQKNGKTEHVPPPRPKRKASHPYPQKAPKNVSQATGALESSSALLDSGHAIRPDLLPGSRNRISNEPLSSWTYNVVPTGSVSNVLKDDNKVSGVNAAQNCCSSNSDSTPRMWTCDEINYQVKASQQKAVKVMPDFAQVYGYIGSIFDPEARDHLQRLKKMDPVNVETVLMLMKNLSFNLVSSELEDHRRLLSSYNVGGENSSMDMGCTISSA